MRVGPGQRQPVVRGVVEIERSKTWVAAAHDVDQLLQGAHAALYDPSTSLCELPQLASAWWQRDESPEQARCLHSGQRQSLCVTPIILGAAGEVGLAGGIGAIGSDLDDVEAVRTQRVGEDALAGLDDDTDRLPVVVLADQIEQRAQVVGGQIGAGGTERDVVDDGDADLAMSPVDADGLHMELLGCDAGRHLETAASPVSLYDQRF